MTTNLLCHRHFSVGWHVRAPLLPEREPTTDVVADCAAWVGDLDAALREPLGDPRGEREAAELLQWMLAAGLSKFEPDLLDALDRIEAERATA